MRGGGGGVGGRGVGGVGAVVGHSGRGAGVRQLQLLQFLQVLVSEGEELPVALLNRALLLSYPWIPPDVVRDPEL